MPPLPLPLFLLLLLLLSPPPAPLSPYSSSYYSPGTTAIEKVSTCCGWRRIYLSNCASRKGVCGSSWMV